MVSSSCVQWVLVALTRSLSEEGSERNGQRAGRGER